MEIAANTTPGQYRGIVRAIVEHIGDEVLETLEGPGNIVTVIETRKVCLTAYVDDMGITSFPCHDAPLLDVMELLERNLDGLLETELFVEL